MNTIVATTSVIGGSADMMKPALFVLFIILAVLFSCCIALTALSRKRRGRITGSRKLLMCMMYLSTIAVLVCTLVCYAKYNAYSASLPSGNNTGSFFHCKR